MKCPDCGAAPKQRRSRGPVALLWCASCERTFTAQRFAHDWGAYSAPAAGEYANERWDCSVRAAMVACAASYADAHAAMELAGRKRRDGFYCSKMGAALDLLALYRPLGKGTENYHPARSSYIYPAPTLAAFIREHPRGRYVLRRKGHFFALVDGTVHDWRATRTGARTRITDAWEVIAPRT